MAASVVLMRSLGHWRFVQLSIRFSRCASFLVSKRFRVNSRAVSAVFERSSFPPGLLPFTTASAVSDVPRFGRGVPDSLFFSINDCHVSLPGLQFANSFTAKPTSSSTETPPRKTITTGTITTSSEVQETVTTTDDQGGVFVTTLTSWVEVRPTPTGSADPSLQNAAPAGRGAGGVAAAAIAGVVAGVLAF